MSVMDKQREKLIKLINNYPCMSTAEDCFMESISSDLADYLLANGVIVPPCKVGDTVYTHNAYVWSHECRNCEHFFIGGFGDPNECGRTEDGSKHPDCIQIEETVITQHDILYYLCFDKFGKTVFLSREDAEKALEGVE